MFTNVRIVLEDLGSILMVVGVLMMLLLIVSIAFGEFGVVTIVSLTALITLGIGILLKVTCRVQKEPQLKHAMITAALAWLVIPAISSILFIFIENMSPLDSFFEAMSGWTGTGLTMVAHPSSLTHTVQFWRSTMQWVGGVGVIVLMVTILARPGTGSYLLYRAEAREEKIRPSIISSVRIIWWIYLLLTAIGIVLFYFAGMSLWEAINHSMTALGTGGFTITENSMAFYDSPLIELAIMPMMLLGAIPFIIHYQLLKGELRAFFRDLQIRALCVLLLVLLTLLLIVNYTGFYSSAFAALRFSTFQIVSGLTCTGFQTANVHLWSGQALSMVWMAMLIGGGAGSTAGGIKLIRAVIVWKGLNWSLIKTLLPKNAIKPFRFGERLLNDEEINSIGAEANLIIILWIVFLLIGVGVLTVAGTPGYTLNEVIFEVVSAQSNVGLSTGITSTGMLWGGKIMLILNMWIGRLEIIPVLMLVRVLAKGFEPL
ncbi:MAG: TrkH family potassium uptake protein [Methanomicrobia archaeon]|nr:TrkH family potassium uptake protein [Methanomicrobia archaeon]